MATAPLQLKHPIVLVHGLGARSTSGPIHYFYGLPPLLTESKNQLLVASLASWHTIETRSAQLREQIEKTYPDQKVNLVGHSMGGLDARFLAAQPDFAERVASVTTIGTPHRGSIMGDIAIQAILGVGVSVLETVVKFFETSYEPLKQVSHQFCTSEFMKMAPDQPGVAYFSATSAITKPLFKNALPFFWLPHEIIMKTEGENDGFVSVTSAKWGDHICTYQGDHYGQIGQFLGYSRGMDYMKFYKEIFSYLKTQGM